MGNEESGKKHQHDHIKKGMVRIGGKEMYARSGWEANIATYFEFLKQKGEIKEWEHEPYCFWFENIKRGVRSYLPDFKITKNDDTTYFVEVKGYLDARSAVKIKRMAKYYPAVRLELIDKKRYASIRKASGIIPNWGILG